MYVCTYLHTDIHKYVTMTTTALVNIFENRSHIKPIMLLLVILLYTIHMYLLYRRMWFKCILFTTIIHVSRLYCIVWMMMMIMNPQQKYQNQLKAARRVGISTRYGKNYGVKDTNNNKKDYIMYIDLIPIWKYLWSFVIFK